MFEKIENNSQNNNTLSIIEEFRTKEKASHEKILVTNENIPIKPIKIFKSAEEYYSYYYPEYKLLKLGNILFCKMGNVITFSFDTKKNFKPRFSIGPHWYMTLVLISTVLAASIGLYFLIFKKTYFIFRFIFFLLAISTYIFIARSVLIHTEIANNKYQDATNNVYCDKCKIYYNRFNRVEHCRYCDICFNKKDHHCLWVGKCIGKDNLREFFQMIIVGTVYYFFVIASLIIYFAK